MVLGEFPGDNGNQLGVGKRPASGRIASLEGDAVSVLSSFNEVEEAVLKGRLCDGELAGCAFKDGFHVG